MPFSTGFLFLFFDFVFDFSIEIIEKAIRGRLNFRPIIESFRVVKISVFLQGLGLLFSGGSLLDEFSDDTMSVDISSFADGLFMEGGEAFVFDPEGAGGALVEILFGLFG